MFMNDLEQLRRILNAALDVMEEERRENALPDFDLQPRLHPYDSADSVPSSRLYQARRSALAALGQIKASIQPAHEQLAESAMLSYDIIAIYTLAKSGVFDILASDDVEKSIGLHVTEIYERMDDDKKFNVSILTRLLRLCTANCWATETRPNIFANNRVSCSLFTNKGGLVEKSETYYWVDAVSRNGLKSVIKAYETWTDPETRDEISPAQSAWVKGSGFNGTFWDFLAANPAELQSFALGMTGYGACSQAACYADYDWASLGKKTIVDVGSGRGSFTLPLLAKFPDLSLVLQDLPIVIPAAEAYYQSDFADIIDKSRVKFEAQDFFQPNVEVGDDKVYVLRWILHDWSDALAIKILHALSSVMTADSRILLIESVIQAGNIDETSASLDFPERLRSIDDKLHSFHPIQAPAPLSSNFGCAEKANLQVDVGMASWFNGSDRTLPQLREVATAAGLEVREVIYTRSFHSIIELRKPAPQAPATEQSDVSQHPDVESTETSRQEENQSANGAHAKAHGAKKLFKDMKKLMHIS